MDYRFIITLTEHRTLGYVFAPYLVRKERGNDYYTVYDRVTLLNLTNYEPVLSPEETQLTKLIEEYNEQHLYKIFSKKKTTSREFMKSIRPEFMEQQVRPYIERRMAKCLDILTFNPVPVYLKLLQKTVYLDDQIRVVEDEGSAVFNFIRNGEGLRYFLSIEHNGNQLKLNGKNGIIVTNEPCCIIIDDKMFVFHDIDGKKLTPFFTREYISIPKSAEKKYFETFVRNAIRKYKVNARGFMIEESNDTPRAVLSVERDLAGRFYIVLKFMYGENTIYYANRKTSQKVNCEFNGDQVTFVRVQRNYEFENENISKLLSIGLVNKDGPYFEPLQKKSAGDSDGYSVINWINFNSPLIRQSGFSYYLDDFSIHIEVSEKSNDWFDIEARVDFAGFKIPFTAFYNNILNGEHEYELPDGRIMILPEEWFENYRDMLSFARVDKETLKLDKQHFPLLNKNLRGISPTLKNSLLSLMETDRMPEDIPQGIEALLRNYQVEGYSWMYRLHRNGFGGCLADDMGLGKTLQTLTLLRRVVAESEQYVTDGHPSNKKVSQLSLFDSPAEIKTGYNAASLIVVPTSLVHNWINEALRFVPSLKISAYIGAQRKPIEELYRENDLIITSYGILRNDLSQFAKLNFLCLVLDESQMIKNPGSKTYQSVIQIRATNRIVLTGTPIENSLSDLWAQINFLNPGLLGNLNFFRSEFQLPIEKYNDENKQEKLRKLIAPFVLRRSKSQVATELPPVNEQIVYCNLDEQQEAFYEREKSKARNLVIETLAKSGFGKSSVIILQSLTRLRQIANHPGLVDENYLGNSGKFDEITRNLVSLKQEGHKALVFSSFVKHLDLIADFLEKNDLPFAYLTGETKDREKEIKKFQQDDQCPFFLISLKAGGVGLNLTAADYVFILDPWWNPAAEMQAISRAHRIGQDKHIFVYRFIARNTLEEKIIKLQERKSSLADTFVNSDLKNVTKEQVMELFE